MIEMSDKRNKHHIQELKKMVKEKSSDQPTEKILAIFCERHGLSPETCRHYYNLLVENGDIKEK
jgi:predicted solute-binding protein